MQAHAWLPHRYQCYGCANAVARDTFILRGGASRIPEQDRLQLIALVTLSDKTASGGVMISIVRVRSAGRELRVKREQSG